MSNIFRQIRERRKKSDATATESSSQISYATSIKDTRSSATTLSEDKAACSHIEAQATRNSRTAESTDRESTKKQRQRQKQKKAWTSPSSCSREDSPPLDYSRMTPAERHRLAVEKVKGPNFAALEMRGKGSLLGGFVPGGIASCGGGGGGI